MNIKCKKAFGKEVGGDLERQHASPRAEGNDRERDKCWEFLGEYLPTSDQLTSSPPLPFLLWHGTQDWSHLPTLSS